MSEDIDNKLNKREKYKARLKPYNYFTKEFATLDPDSLGEGDRFYLQDFGIFNTDFLEDEFTIRLRNAHGGRFTPQEFATIAKIVHDYDLTLVITARSGFQLHDVYADDLLEIWHKLNDNGLTTWQSFGDNIRNIVTDVYDGVSQHAHIEAYPIIKQMNEYIIKNPKYVGMLPRRVSIGISGNSANVNSFFANDIYFALAKKDDRYGFNVYMGGKNTEVAQDVDIFLEKEDVFDFFKAFVTMFYEHGSRFSRSKTRFYYMLQEHGIAKIKVLLKEQFQKEFVPAGELILKHVDFEPFEALREGKFGYCYQSNFGKITAEEMQRISTFATEHNAEIRVGTDQNIYLVGLPSNETPFDSPALSATIVACAGNLCPYSAWSIKEEANEYLPLETIYKNRIKIGFSGCAKGCGRHRHTDIGLIGLKTNNFGDVEGGARVFIGAEHDTGQSVARQLFSLVPFVHLKQTLSLVIALFEQSGYKNFQQYAHNILSYYSEDFLSLWHLMNLKTEKQMPLSKQEQPLTQEEELHLLREHFTTFTLVEENIKKSINALSKELWTVGDVDAHYKPPIERTAVR